MCKELNTEERHTSGKRENECETKTQCNSLKCEEKRGIPKPKQYRDAKGHLANSKEEPWLRIPHAQSEMQDEETTNYVPRNAMDGGQHNSSQSSNQRKLKIKHWKHAKKSKEVGIQVMSRPLLELMLFWKSHT